MGSVNLSGSLSAGPTGASAVPSGTASFQVATTPDPKPSSVTASGVKLLNSPSSYQTLGGIGATQDVTTANFLYLKADGPIKVRITRASSAVSVEDVQGTLMIEAPDTALITMVEVQGAATLEYFASGSA